MRCPSQGHRLQIGQGQHGASRVYRPRRDLSTQDGGHLQVHEFRRGKPFTAQPGPGEISVGTIVSQGGDQDTSVNDEHGRPGARPPLLSAAPSRQSACYWYRASSAKGDLNSIIANDNVAPGAHVIVTIADTDRHSSPTAASEWNPAPRIGPNIDRIGEGTWAVGIDIRPGTYAVKVPAESYNCYWQRMSDFSGEIDSIIANDNVRPGAQASVTITATDRGFKSGGCGTWQRR